MSIASKDRIVWYDGPRPVPIMIGFAPPSESLDHCPPMVSGATGRWFEQLCGIPRNSLPLHYAAMWLFSTHASGARCTARRLAKAGGDIRRVIAGRVVVAVGARVRSALRLDAFEYGQWYDDGVTRAVCLPRRGDVWYNGRRPLARQILADARDVAQNYGLWA